MNAVWRQSASTGRARLVLLAIADHQGEIGAWPSIATLARMVNASERSVQRDIQELVDLGELEVHVQAAPSRGQYKSNLYWVTLPGVSGVTEIAPGVTDSTSGVTDLASGVTTGGVLTLIEPLQKPNKNLAQEKLERAFAEFWKVYPRKVGKNEAKKAFAKAHAVANGEVVLGAQRFAADPNLPTDKNYIPHPATWLNAGRWEDEPLPHREKSPEEKAALAKAEAERRRLVDLEASRRIREESEAARRALELNPPKKCEHGRVAVICTTCARTNR